MALAACGLAQPSHAEFQIESTLPESVFQAVKQNDYLSTARIQRFSEDGSRLIGSFVVGSDDEAFVWSDAEGVVLLGDFSGGRDDATPTDITPDGGTIVGRSWSSSRADEAFIWDDTNGFQLLESPPSGYIKATPLAISDDGTTVVGYMIRSVGPAEAFRWTSATGIVPLGNLSGSQSTFATAVSTDGSAVTGYGLVPGGREAFRWTMAEGLVPLGDLPGSHFWSQGQHISDNGDFVAGFGWVQDTCDGQCSYAAQRAFRWSQAEGMVDLDSFTTFLPTSTPISASSDGSVVVGYAADNRHFLWREGIGNEQFEPLFAAESETDDADWEIRPLQVVDDGDGFAILGVGRHLSDEPVVWRLRLEALPICSDGVDNDTDGFTDFPADAGCRHANWALEAPACQDGIDNDGDGFADWDGAGVGSPDPDCPSPWRASERAPSSCGLAGEMLFLAIGWVAMARRWRFARAT